MPSQTPSTGSDLPPKLIADQDFIEERTGGGELI